MTPAIIILSVIALFVFAAFLGFWFGAATANTEIVRQRHIVDTLQGEVSALQSKMLAMVDETTKGVAK